MLSAEKMQSIIGWVLMIGTLSSAVIVAIGGGIYLYENGSKEMSEIVIDSGTSFHFALGLVKLGLLLLVAVQSIRVALLFWFYTAIKDYKFSLISAFILAVLIYSTFWRS